MRKVSKCILYLSFPLFSVLIIIVLLVDWLTVFPAQHFVCHSAVSGFHYFDENSAINYIVIHVLYDKSFSFCYFQDFSLHLSFSSLLIMMILSVNLFVIILVWHLLSFLDVQINILNHIWECFGHNTSNIYFELFSSSFSIGM